MLFNKVFIILFKYCHITPLMQPLIIPIVEALSKLKKRSLGASLL